MISIIFTTSQQNINQDITDCVSTFTIHVLCFTDQAAEVLM